MNLTETKNGTVIEVFVRPNSKKFEVTLDDEEIIVRCTEEPTKGKVNKEIIREFSKMFHEPVEIVHGLTSKEKKILVAGIGKSEVEKILGYK